MKLFSRKLNQTNMLWLFLDCSNSYHLVVEYSFQQVHHTLPCPYKYSSPAKHSLIVEGFRRRGRIREAENKKYNKRDQLHCRHTTTEKLELIYHAASCPQAEKSSESAVNGGSLLYDNTAPQFSDKMPCFHPLSEFLACWTTGSILHVTQFMRKKKTTTKQSKLTASPYVWWSGRLWLRYCWLSPEKTTGNLIPHLQTKWQLYF